ncbi:unnamed protein product, partial [Ilex paraguariensis]
VGVNVDARESDELEKSGEVSAGCGGPRIGLLVHAIARSQARSILSSSLVVREFHPVFASLSFFVVLSVY